MKTEDLLNLDCRKEKNKQILNKCVKKTDYAVMLPGMYDIGDLEDILHTMCRAEKVGIQSINVTYDTDSFMYVASFVDCDSRAWAGNAYGSTIWELFAKSIILVYSYCRRKKRDERNTTGNA